MSMSFSESGTGIVVPIPVLNRMPPLGRDLSIDEIQYHTVVSSGPWLSSCYRLLQSEFDDSTLDPLSRYAEWLTMGMNGTHPFPFLMVAAYIVRDANAYVIGTLSGNVMALTPDDAPTKEARGFMFAIGHQVTSLALRQSGVKGVGTTLWSAAAAQADSIIASLDGVALYSVLEAERASIGFWDRLGYLCPEGVPYWQPPLEFNGEGHPVLPEVPETLMLKPLAILEKERIASGMLRSIVLALYNNWSLHKCRNSLGHTAYTVAKDYVLRGVYGRVEKHIPRRGWVTLMRASSARLAGNSRGEQL